MSWASRARVEASSRTVSLSFAGSPANRHSGCTITSIWPRIALNQPPRWSSTISAMASDSVTSSRSVPAISSERCAEGPA